MARFILDKIRKHGIKESLKIGARLSLIKLSAALARLPWFLRPVFYYNLFRLILIPAGNRRILGVYDLRIFPWGVGDPLVFVETLSVLKIKNKAEAVDICVLYDQDDPSYRERAGNVNRENARDYMLEFLPLFGTCPFLGTIHQFNSRLEFYNFIRMNAGRYDIYPSLGINLGEKDIFRGTPPILSPMEDFFKLNGYIPYLRIGERDFAWAKWFYMNNLRKGSIPVCLSLKNTLHRPLGNADPQAWLPFIDRCGTEFPEVTFCVVGLREEALPGLRERKNVVIAKDHGTSLIEDLALIRSSFLYMGTSSGVNIVAIFSDLPYIITQFENSNYTRHGMKPDDKFSFVGKNQKIFNSDVRVTSDMLFKEFSQLYSDLDKDKWFKAVENNAMQKHSHPTAKAAA